MDADRSPEALETPEAPGSALVLVSVALFFFFCSFALLRAAAVRISHINSLQRLNPYNIHI